MPLDIMIYFAEVSLAETARIGQCGRYLETRIAEDPEFVKTIMSFAFIS
jgi:hypothetical protein